MHFIFTQYTFDNILFCLYSFYQWNILIRQSCYLIRWRIMLIIYFIYSVVDIIMYLFIKKYIFFYLK